MKRLALIVILLSISSFSQKASALTVGSFFYSEVCIDNKAFCAVHVINKSTGDWHLEIQDIYKNQVPLGTNIGMRYWGMNDEIYYSLKNRGMETVDATTEQLREDLINKHYDEKMAHNAFTCTLSGVACGGALVSSALTSWLTLPLALLECARDRLACEDMDQANVELTKQRNKELETLKAESGSSGSAGGDSQGSGQTPPPNQNPGPGTSAPIEVSHQGGSIISEPKDGTPGGGTPCNKVPKPKGCDRPPVKPK